MTRPDFRKGIYGAWPEQSSREDLENFLSECDGLPRLPTVGDLLQSAATPGRADHPADSVQRLVVGANFGHLHVIAGPPEIGQRALAWCVAEVFARTRGPVLYLSLGLDGGALVRMVLDGKSGRLGRNARPQQADPTSAVVATMGLHGLPIEVDDRPSLTLRDIERRLESPGGAPWRAVVVDSVERLVPPAHGRNLEERLWARAILLRHLAQHYQSALFVTCDTDVSYGPDDMPLEVRRRDVPRALRHEADHLWLLHRDDYFFAEGGRQLTVTVVSRHGRTPRVVVDMTSGWPAETAPAGDDAAAR